MGYYGQTEELIRRSGAEARRLGHSYVGSVHLLLALCQMSGGTAQLLRSFGIEPEFLRQLTMLLYGVGRAELPLPQGLTRAAFYLFPGLEAGVFDFKSDEDFAMKFLHEKHILVIPGHGFDWFEDLRFRIVMLPEPERITAAMESLGEFLDEHRR